MEYFRRVAIWFCSPALSAKTLSADAVWDRGFFRIAEGTGRGRLPCALIGVPIAHGDADPVAAFDVRGVMHLKRSRDDRVRGRGVA